MAVNQMKISYIGIIFYLAMILALTSLAQGQLRDITGTVKTPAGVAIMDAHVWIDPGTYGTDYYTNSLGGYTVSYMPGYVNKYLRISKAGWEFTPTNYLITAATASNLVRNFTGIQVTALTSGKSAKDFVDAGGSKYFSTQVPAGATQLDIEYDGTGNANLAAQLGSVPAVPGIRGPEPKATTPTHKTLTINASSAPALSAGKWYIALTGAEATSFTLKVLLSGPAGPLSISGVVYACDGMTSFPMEGARVMADNGGTSQVTAVDGVYAVTVPYYWSGTVHVENDYVLNFSPASRQYSNLETDQPEQYYREICITSTTLEAYLLGKIELNADEQAAADLNSDLLLDIADLVASLKEVRREKVPMK